MNDEFEEIYDLIEEDPDFEHEGELTWDMLKRAILVVEAFIRSVSNNRTFQQKAFHALVEMLQNAYRYREPETPINLFVKKYENKIYILTENYLSVEDFKNLKLLIDLINSLSLEQIKDIKIEQLITGKVDPKFKKYNGMMSIRRRTMNRILYSFTKDEDGSMVSLIASIDIA